MPATGKGKILGSPGGRMGTWKVALVQVRGGGAFALLPVPCAELRLDLQGDSFS